MTYTLQKNLNVLLRALIQAKAEGLPVQLVVTSRLDDRPPACHEADEKLITEHKLIESGYLRPAGPQFGADLLRLYSETEACVFASFCESFGHPLVEALALDKPLVCADLPYAREICGAAAVYFHPDRPEELAEIWRRWPVREAQTIDRGELLARFSWRDHTARLLRVCLGDD
jgi:glycosyltransferase involved in cell wall biosynthesis